MNTLGEHLMADCTGDNACVYCADEEEQIRRGNICWLCLSPDVVYIDAVGSPWCAKHFDEVFMSDESANG